MHKLVLIVLSLSVFLSACEDPSVNKAKAKTSEPSNVATNTQTLTAAAVALPISPDNSKIEWTGSKVTGSHEGGFTKFNGTISLVGDKPENSSVSVDIETASVYANVDQLTQHLKTADFFDVEKYPKATFA